MIREWRRRSRHRRQIFQPSNVNRTDAKVPEEELNILAETFDNIFTKRSINSTSDKVKTENFVLKNIPTSIGHSNNSIKSAAITTFSALSLAQRLTNLTDKSNVTTTTTSATTTTHHKNSTTSTEVNSTLNNSFSSTSSSITLLNTSSKTGISIQNYEINLTEKDNTTSTTKSNKSELFDPELFEKQEIFEKFLIGLLVAVGSVFTALVLFATVRFIIRQVRRKPYSSIELTDLKGYYDWYFCLERCFFYKLKMWFLVFFIFLKFSSLFTLKKNNENTFFCSIHNKHVLAIN